MKLIKQTYIYNKDNNEYLSSINNKEMCFVKDRDFAIDYDNKFFIAKYIDLLRGKLFSGKKLNLKHFVIGVK
jgi:hypothetical protein